MKIQKKITFIFIMFIIFTLIGMGSAAAKSDGKVEICHKIGNGSYALSSINSNALQAHLAHGDAAPGEAVPGQPGKVFAADCSVTSTAQNSSAQNTAPQTKNVPSTTNQGKKADKVDICHRRGNGTYILINVNGNALPAHIGHGDGLPNGLVPFRPHMKFGADCSLIEIPQKELVQTLTISSVDTTPVSSMALDNGQLYELKASGTYIYDEYGDWADAEWFLLNGEIVKGDDLPNFPPNVLDLTINGCTNNTDWGDYQSTHVYTMQWMGTGQPLTFIICDVKYPDNVGALTVEIWRINW